MQFEARQALRIKKIQSRLTDEKFEIVEVCRHIYWWTDIEGNFRRIKEKDIDCF